MEKSNQNNSDKKEILKSTSQNEKEYKLTLSPKNTILNKNNNQNNITNNQKNKETLEKSYNSIKDLPLQMSAAEKSKDKVNLKYRKFTTNKNQPWKIKEISLAEMTSYDFLIKLLKASLDPSISNSENLKIIFHINKKDKIYASVNSKEDWEANFSLNKKDEFLKAVISEIKTIKIEFELQDLNKNFNEIANKLDLQNKIIENLFEALKENEIVKQEITECLERKLNLITKEKEKENSSAESKMQSEIFKSKYAKIMQDYIDKVYETLFNNINNFQSLQDDLKKINLDKEFDFNKFDDFWEEDFDNKFPQGSEELQHQDDFDFFGDEGICYRSSFNLDNKEEMISKLIIETRNSLFNK